jgi:hypothetical protein
MIAVALLALACGACAHAPAGGARDAGPGTEPDSVTVALWHLDETGGSSISDAGPFGLTGIAGVDTRTSFGRDRNGRVFSRSPNSFLLIPYNPVLEPAGGFAIEAWVAPSIYALYEDATLAARWTPLANEQSWLFAIVGRRFLGGSGPSSHQSLVEGGDRGKLVFAYQPETASLPQSFFSARAVPLNTWTHVAVTFDGQVVRFYLDGLLDSQYASVGRIRHTETPLLIGNFFDPRALSDFGGDVRAGSSIDDNAWYAFEGMMDEIRLSSTARTVFPVHGSN